MKKQLLLSTAFGALVAVNPALGADLPVKAPIAAPVAAYNWTGCYAGGNVGYSWGRARGDFNDSDIGAGIAISRSISVDPVGVVGGGQIGCNWQNNNWVWGLETDFQGSGEKRTGNFNDPFSDGEGASGTVSQSLEAKIRWFGTLRVRGGVLITPTVWLYGTGGLAYGDVSVSDTITVSGVGTTAFSKSKTNVGWTLGAGVEGAIPNSRDWTWKVEYLYLDLGSLSGGGTDPTIGNFSWNARFTDNIVRVGLNYRFH